MAKKNAAAGGQLDELVVDWEEGMWGPHFGGACPPGANATAAGPAWPRERLSLSATSIGAWSTTAIIDYRFEHDRADGRRHVLTALPVARLGSCWARGADETVYGLE